MCGFGNRRTQTLTRQLQQTKAGNTADLNTCAILLHCVAQTIFHSTLILGRFHVDEVDDNQAADVTQTQLPGDFIRRFKIGVGRGGLDVGASRGAGRVDINGHQCLGLIDHN